MHCNHDNNLFRNQVCKHFVPEQEPNIEVKSELRSNQTTNIEATTVPMGPGNPDGMAVSKTNPHSPTIRTELSYQPPLQRTDSQNMSIQTHDTKKVNDICPTKIKAENEDSSHSAKIR